MVMNDGTLYPDSAMRQLADAEAYIWSAAVASTLSHSVC